MIINKQPPVASCCTFWQPHAIIRTFARYPLPAMDNPGNPNSDLILYYKERANEYEKIYGKPERQNDLLTATQLLQDSFANKTVFEVACGTGYWTEKIAKTARSIIATDINETVLDIAKSKKYSPAVVDFQIADLFALANSVTYENLFGGFIWSHIKLQTLPEFVCLMNNRVHENGTVVFMDNKYVEGSSLPISDTDKLGNTYQTRTLANGTIHNVLKIFPTEVFIRQLLADKASDINFTNLTYYWILAYKPNGRQ